MTPEEQSKIVNLINACQSVLDSLDEAAIHYAVTKETKYEVNAHAVWNMGTALAILQEEVKAMYPVETSEASMYEEQRAKLRSLFGREYNSRLEAGLAVAQLVSCAVVLTREIIWFQPGEDPVRIASLQEVNGKFKWIEEIYPSTRR